jgi:hypothetical protein
MAIAIYHKRLALLILDQAARSLDILELTLERLYVVLNHRIDNDDRVGGFKIFEYIRP